MLSITTSTSDELFSRINIDDSERPGTPEIRGFIVIFAIFGCAAHFKSELRRNGYKESLMSGIVYHPQSAFLLFPYSRDH